MTIVTIAGAINSRHHLAFQYKGHQRLVEPMALGRCKEGIWRLRALQIGGTSSSGFAGDDKPRIFDVVSISDVVVRDSTFSIPHQYRRGDELLVFIEAEL